MCARHKLIDPCSSSDRNAYIEAIPGATPRSRGHAIVFFIPATGVTSQITPVEYSEHTQRPVAPFCRVELKIAISSASNSECRRSNDPASATLSRCSITQSRRPVIARDHSTVQLHARAARHPSELWSRIHHPVRLCIWRSRRAGVRTGQAGREVVRSCT